MYSRKPVWPFRLTGSEVHGSMPAREKMPSKIFLRSTLVKEAVSGSAELPFLTIGAISTVALVSSVRPALSTSLMF